MTTQHTPSEFHVRLENLTTQDIKDLVQQKGRATELDKEIILKDPSSTDIKLKAILDDPDLEIKSIGGQTKSGEMYFYLRANGKQVKIQVACHKLKEEKKI
jgi:hypothetical protein